jgi:hypothetical protein
LNQVESSESPESLNVDDDISQRSDMSASTDGDVSKGGVPTNIVTSLQKETEESGGKWEKKLFVPILKVLRDNHFKNCKASTSKINEIIA